MFEVREFLPRPQIYLSLIVGCIIYADDCSVLELEGLCDSSEVVGKMRKIIKEEK
jgi:hypothetical protein